MPTKKLPKSPVAAKKARRPRRSTEHITDLIIEAAREEFERNGYEGTKTAAIAQRAEVAEALIFSNFGSKAKLFHDSIFKPLNQHFLQFSATHLVEEGDQEGAREWTRQYTNELQQFVARHSGMLRTVIGAQMFGGEHDQELSHVEGLHEFFSLATTWSLKRFSVEAKTHLKLISRVTFATILSCVVFKDWLFPKGTASDEEINTTVSDFIWQGINTDVKHNALKSSKSKTKRSTAKKSTAKKSSSKTAK